MSDTSKLKVLTYLAHHIHPYGIGYNAHSLTLGMNNDNVQADIYSIHSDMAHESVHVKQFIKYRLVLRVLLRVVSRQTVIRFTEKAFLKVAKNYDVIYLWPGCSLDGVKYLKSLGKTVVLENINCHQGTAKKILDEEELRTGFTYTHSITDESVNDEVQKLALADYVFSPNPQVTESLIENGVAAEKIITSSYGLSHAAILPALGHQNVKPVFVHVGSVIMRKGIHLLVDYWKKANIEGVLKFVGKPDPSIMPIIDKYRDDPSIEFIPFTRDLEKVYQTANVFVLTSLEEGSPLVTYEAIGAGLPCLVTPMAGDGVINDGVEGFIVEPHDNNGWVNSLKKLANDSSLRIKMSEAAHQRAEHFTWEKVAADRIEKLLERMDRA